MVCKAPCSKAFHRPPRKSRSTPSSRLGRKVGTPSSRSPRAAPFLSARQRKTTRLNSSKSFPKKAASASCRIRGRTETQSFTATASLRKASRANFYRCKQLRETALPWFLRANFPPRRPCSKRKPAAMKSTVITLTVLILGGIDVARAEATVLKVKADEPACLYGGQASAVGGDIMKQAGDNFRWRGSGHLTWEVWVDQPGEYEVNLCHAVETNAVGQRLQITTGQSQINYTLAMTQGVFGNKSYTLALTQGSLHF